MSIINLARLVVYRFHEKGLEVFLVNNDMKSDPDVWKFPPADVTKVMESMEDNAIEVEVDGEKLIAIEGDWHNIPSIKGLIKHDVKVVKSLVKEVASPAIEHGTFVAFKDTMKKIMPRQYNALKELKEVLVEGNAIKNL